MWGAEMSGDKENTMNPVDRIDAALEKVLRAAGTSLRHYTCPATRERLRSVMRGVMSESYIAGSNAALAAIEGAK